MGRPKKTVDDLQRWLTARSSIAHRAEVLRAGFHVDVLRGLVRMGEARMVRRAWIALPSAPTDLVVAATAGGRVTCTSLARRRGWWLPETVGPGIHLHLAPHAASANLDDGTPHVLHWNRPISPRLQTTLTAPIEDALAHIALCEAPETAHVIWESAVRQEKIAPEALRAVRWTSTAARTLAEAVTGLSDSGLESLVVLPLRRAGLVVRQQVKLAGRFVDLLVGERLVVQIDGYAFHSSAAQRARDIAHDAELRLRGYTVLRFGYAQIVHDRPAVERVIHRAVAAGLHRAA